MTGLHGDRWIYSRLEEVLYFIMFQLTVWFDLFVSHFSNKNLREETHSLIQLLTSHKHRACDNNYVSHDFLIWGQRWLKRVWKYYSKHTINNPAFGFWMQHIKKGSYSLVLSTPGSQPRLLADVTAFGAHPSSPSRQLQSQGTDCTLKSTLVTHASANQTNQVANKKTKQITDRPPVRGMMTWLCNCKTASVQEKVHMAVR